MLNSIARLVSRFRKALFSNRTTPAARIVLSLEELGGRWCPAESL